MMEAIRSSETTALTRATGRTIQDGIPNCHRRENFRAYIVFLYGEATQRHVRWLEYWYYLLLTMFLARWFSSFWWWRRYFPPKRRFLQGPHGVTSQKTPFSIDKTSSQHLPHIRVHECGIVVGRTWFQSDYLGTSGARFVTAVHYAC
jgi:hypothetical protein